jgi:hypothetical protein
MTNRMLLKVRKKSEKPRTTTIEERTCHIARTTGYNDHLCYTLHLEGQWDIECTLEGHCMHLMPSNDISLKTPTQWQST